MTKNWERSVEEWGDKYSFISVRSSEVYMLKTNNMVNCMPCFTIFCHHNFKKPPKGCWISSRRDKICVILKIKQIALFFYLQIGYSYTLLPPESCPEL